MRAFGLTVSGDQLWLQVAVFGVCAVVAVLAVPSLALPFVLRASRMMWVVAIAGAAAALLSVRVATGAGDDGAAAGTALPGVVMCLLGLMSCACMVAGMAVKRFDPLSGQGDRRARMRLTVAGRALLAVVLAAGVCVWSGYGLTRHDAGLSSSGGGLPMVAVDYLEQNPAHRILAVAARSNNHVNTP